MPTPSARGHRPGLDGLRGVLVGLVLVQHVTTTTRWLPGAVGVGLFFALSGYLITGLLVDELTRTRRLALAAFYLRRAARLGPALLFLCAVVGTILALEGSSHRVLGALPALLYVENYVCIAGRGCDPAFSHLWSLGVEEHFYLLWPVVLAAMVRRWGVRGAGWGTAVLAVGSLGWRSALDVTVHPSSGFFYTDSLSRSDSLLFAASMAIAVRMGLRLTGRHLALGLVGLACLLPASTISTSVFSSTLTGVTGALLVAGIDVGTGRAARLLRAALTWRPLVGLGRLSYGVYLWHAALIVVVLDAIGHDDPVLRLAAVVLSLPVAWTSHRVVEAPVREWVRRRQVITRRELSVAADKVLV